MLTKKQFRTLKKKIRAQKRHDRHLSKICRNGKISEYFNRLNTHFKMKPIGKDDFRRITTDTHRYKRSKGTITSIIRLPPKN